ncbi:MAG: hypothetical protein CFE21_03940 [Bacteroidetes bacterium B1(2017)]|nr:MAG: hypothetical protein CFE21_03940 [Bacteroidetes bacterium B1(2017)]
MPPKNLNKRLVWNFFSLPLGLFIAFGITVLLGFLVEKFSGNQYSDVGIPAGMGDGMAVGYLGIGLCIAVALWWTIRMLIDIYKHWKNRKFVILNILILLLPFAIIGTNKLNVFIKESSVVSKTMGQIEEGRNLKIKKLFSYYESDILYCYTQNDTGYFVTGSDKDSAYYYCKKKGNLNKVIVMKPDLCWQKDNYACSAYECSLRYFAICKDSIWEISNKNKIIEKVEKRYFLNELRNSYGQHDTIRGTYYVVKSDSKSCINGSFEIWQNCFMEISDGKGKLNYKELNGFALATLYRPTSQRIIIRDKKDRIFALVTPSTCKENEKALYEKNTIYIGTFRKDISSVTKIPLQENFFTDNLEPDNIAGIFSLGDRFYLFGKKGYLSGDIGE